LGPIDYLLVEWPGRQPNGEVAPQLRGVVRTAAIAGTATAVSNRVSRRQARRWAAQEPVQPAPAPVAAAPAPATAPPAPATAPPAPPTSAELIDELKQLGELKSQGIPTEEEFDAQKAKLLA
jgi:hypothetical protein